MEFTKVINICIDDFEEEEREEERKRKRKRAFACTCTWRCIGGRSRRLYRSITWQRGTDNVATVVADPYVVTEYSRERWNRTLEHLEKYY